MVVFKKMSFSMTFVVFQLLVTINVKGKGNFVHQQYFKSTLWKDNITYNTYV